ELVGWAGWSEQDDGAIATLGQELEEVRPLLEVFDGELEIIRRLGSALSDVQVIRPEDRDLVFEALAFQGFSIHRYFQDTLATDPTAAS
ncbi:MAG: hypothetical protein QGG40_01050, partial [Myxococcota bacterium]|nr:hypothetical protein [Myxococcota bacterium]